MANISNMTRQEFIQLLEKREKRRKKLRRKRRIITLILFSLAVCITNTVVAFAAEQDTPQTKITIKVAEPVKLVIKVANQDIVYRERYVSAIFECTCDTSDGQSARTHLGHTYKKTGMIRAPFKVVAIDT